MIIKLTICTSLEMTRWETFDRATESVPGVGESSVSHRGDVRAADYCELQIVVVGCWLKDSSQENVLISEEHLTGRRNRLI